MCYQQCGECLIPVAKMLPCGHTQRVPCSTQPHEVKCMGKCTKYLPCGHACQNICGERHTEICKQTVRGKFKCGHVGNILCFKVDRSMYLCIFYGVEYFKNLKFVRKSVITGNSDVLYTIIYLCCSTSTCTQTLHRVKST